MQKPGTKDAFTGGQVVDLRPRGVGGYLNFPRRPHDDISVVITEKTRVKFAWRHIVPSICAILDLKRRLFHGSDLCAISWSGRSAN